MFFLQLHQKEPIWDLSPDQMVITGLGLRAIRVKPCNIMLSWHIQLQEKRKCHEAFLQLPLRDSLIQNNSNSNSKLLHPSAKLVTENRVLTSEEISLHWKDLTFPDGAQVKAQRERICSGPSSLLTFIWLLELELNQWWGKTRICRVATKKKKVTSRFNSYFCQLRALLCKITGAE